MLPEWCTLLPYRLAHCPAIHFLARSQGASHVHQQPTHGKSRPMASDWPSCAANEHAACIQDYNTDWSVQSSIRLEIPLAKAPQHSPNGYHCYCSLSINKARISAHQMGGQRRPSAATTATLAHTRFLPLPLHYLAPPSLKTTATGLAGHATHTPTRGTTPVTHPPRHTPRDNVTSTRRASQQPPAQTNPTAPLRRRLVQHQEAISPHGRRRGERRNALARR